MQPNAKDFGENATLITVELNVRTAPHTKEVL